MKKFDLAMRLAIKETQLTEYNKAKFFLTVLGSESTYILSKNYPLVARNISYYTVDGKESKELGKARQFTLGEMIEFIQADPSINDMHFSTLKAACKYAIQFHGLNLKRNGLIIKQLSQ